MSLSFGEIDVTTVNEPDGGTGATFRPQFLNASVAYAKSFSESIHVGFQLTVISETIGDASATGAALDMGIQYVTGRTTICTLALPCATWVRPCAIAAMGRPFN